MSKTNGENNVLYGGDIEEEIPVSLGELMILMLRSHQDKVLQVDPANGQELRAGTLLERAIRLASWLRNDANIRTGDTIAVSSDNNINFCLPPVAAFLAAAAVAPINAEYTPDEFKHALYLSRPKIIFCSTRVLGKVLSVVNEAPFVERVIVLDQASGGRKAESVEGILERQSHLPCNEYQCPEVDSRDIVATVLCSSGTTGLPKGVLTTQYNILSVLSALRQVSNYGDSEELEGPTMGLIPFFHSFGFMTMLLALIVGRTLVIINKFNIRLFLKAIQDYRITLIAVPPVVVALMCQCEYLHEYDLSSLREVRSGAAPLPREFEKLLPQKLKIKSVRQGYGMTETTLSVLFMPNEAYQLGSVGKLVPGMYGKVIDENGKALGPNQEGELCFRGPLIMKGYSGNSEATANIIDKDNWMHTGDVGYYNQEGYFYIVDRIKELIKYKGYQVPPAELEALLMSHEGVLDCAVVGLPDTQTGELPLAFVVRRPGSNVTPLQLQEFVSARVSPAKHLRGGVRFTSSIPRNPSGKILRRVLRQIAINNAAAKL